MRFPALAAAALCVATTAAAASGGLAGKWRIVAVSGAEGLDVSRAQAEFAANGRFASTVGCNRIAGKPAVSGQKLAFGPMMATRMACPPPLDAVERQYLSALEAVRSYRMEGGRLLFLDESGDGLVTLERAK